MKKYFWQSHTHARSAAPNFSMHPRGRDPQLLLLVVHCGQLFWMVGWIKWNKENTLWETSSYGWELWGTSDCPDCWTFINCIVQTDPCFKAQPGLHKARTDFIYHFTDKLNVWTNKHVPKQQMNWKQWSLAARKYSLKKSESELALNCRYIGSCEVKDSVTKRKHLVEVED